MTDSGLPGFRSALRRIERAAQWRTTLRSLADLTGALPAAVTARRALDRLAAIGSPRASAPLHGSAS